MRSATTSKSKTGTVLLLFSLVALCVLPVTGCRDSAPDDVIVEEETTAAIVFVVRFGGAFPESANL